MAAAAPMEDEQVVRFCQPVVRQLPDQSLLGMFYVLLVYQTDPVRDPEHMRVHRDLLLSEPFSEHDVCSLPSDTGKRLQFRPAPRHLAVEIRCDLIRKIDYILSLLMIHPDPLNKLFHILRYSISKVLRPRISFKKLRRYLVHAHIRSLSREHSSHEQLPHILVLQLTLRVRVFISEQVQHLHRLRFCKCFLCH